MRDWRGEWMIVEDQGECMSEVAVQGVGEQGGMGGRGVVMSGREVMGRREAMISEIVAAMV